MLNPLLVLPGGCAQGPLVPGDGSVPAWPLLKPPGWPCWPCCSPALWSCAARFAFSDFESSASSSCGPAASPSHLGGGELRKCFQNAARFWLAPLWRGARGGCSHPGLVQENPREKLGSCQAPRVSAMGLQGLVTASGTGRSTRRWSPRWHSSFFSAPCRHLPAQAFVLQGRGVHVLFLAPRQSHSSTVRGEELGSNHGSRC